MLIKVKVFPESKIDQVIKQSADSYIVKVSEKAENGKANRRVREIEVYDLL